MSSSTPKCAPAAAAASSSIITPIPVTREQKRQRRQQQKALKHRMATEMSEMMRMTDCRSNSSHNSNVTAQSSSSTSSHTSSSTTTTSTATATTTPQDVNLTLTDIETAARVLNTIELHPTLLDHSTLRVLRVNLAPLVHRLGFKWATNGLYSDEVRKHALKILHDTKDNSSSSIKDQVKEEYERRMDVAARNRTTMRAKRIRNLELLNSNIDLDAIGEMSKTPTQRIPDGVALTDGSHDVNMNMAVESMRKKPRIASASSPMSTLYSMPSNPSLHNLGSHQSHSLHHFSLCYICKSPFTLLHHFYSALCPRCASFNYAKREQSADMAGKIVLLTGGRVKIGYRVLLKLLRSGAFVITTTRFPNDLARRLSYEKDSDLWYRRCHIYGLDFRNLDVLEQFVQWLDKKYTHLDVIINNACQTVRRPPEYYRHLLPGEKRTNFTNEKVNQLVQHHHSFSQQVISGLMNTDEMQVDCRSEDTRHGDTQLTPILSSAISNKNNNHNSSNQGSSASVIRQGSCKRSYESQQASHSVDQSLFHSSRSSTSLSTLSSVSTQLCVLSSDRKGQNDTKLFPTCEYDVNGQQIDLRSENSWTMKLADVPVNEASEVMTINFLAPFLLNSKLKSLMIRGNEDRTKPRFIVNVSAMEGQFYRFKTSNHPHTNAAKAALNMLTRTSAHDYVRSSIFMNSIDTGWINDENPLPKAFLIASTYNFQTPLDEVDAAARLLDPIFTSIHKHRRSRTAQQSGSREPFNIPYGCFLKDYTKCEW